MFFQFSKILAYLEGILDCQFVSDFMYRLCFSSTQYYSSDKEDHLVVHIFQPRAEYMGNPTNTTFTHNKHRTVITLDPTSNAVTFAYTPDPDTNNPINPDDFKVAKLVIHNWTKKVDDDLPKLRSIEVVSGDNPIYIVYIDYAAADSGNLKSIFSTWTEKALSGDGGGS